MNGNLPSFSKASEVYSKAYRVLERMARRGHVTMGRYCAVGRNLKGKAIMDQQRHVSDEMRDLIDALDAGDEEKIKGLLLMTHIYPSE